MNWDLIDSPTDFTAYELAEWLEVNMLLFGRPSISRTSLMRSFPVGQAPDAAEFDQLFGEIRRRSAAAPSLYPYRDTGDEISTAGDVDGRIYYLLLILSVRNAPYRRDSRYNEINPSFELITREAIVKHFGDGTKGVRFGWPEGDDRPEKLADAVEWLADRMGLPVGNVREEVDDDDKDGGIDVAVWKPFSDGRPSFPVWLVQCTVQSTFERKPSDVDPNRWRSWINFGTAPNVALSIPFALPPDAKIWFKLQYSVDLLMDRLRLIEALGDNSTIQRSDEWKLMAEWTSAEVEATTAALNAPSAVRPQTAKRRRPRRVPSANQPRELAG